MFLFRRIVKPHFLLNRIVIYMISFSDHLFDCQTKLICVNKTTVNSILLSVSFSSFIIFILSLYALLIKFRK